MIFDMDGSGKGRHGDPLSDIDSVLNWKSNKCYSSSPIKTMTSDNHSVSQRNNYQFNSASEKGESVDTTRGPPHHNTNKSASIMSSSANCDNYNPMCQLYDSINSRQEFPIIKQSTDPHPDNEGWWNNFSRRRRARPPTKSQSQMSSSMRNVIALLLIIVTCPRVVWSWSAQRDPSFYHQPAEDYYSGNNSRQTSPSVTIVRGHWFPRGSFTPMGIS